MLKKERQSNFELLRIFAMFIIIAHHLALHSHFNFSNNPISINELVMIFFKTGGGIGINIFILISGYFLIDTKKEKIIKLWLQLFTYSFLITLIFATLYPNIVNHGYIILSVLPILSMQWWYASSYFIVYLLATYINKLLRIMNKKTYIISILFMFLFSSILPHAIDISFLTNTIWLLFMYTIGGFIRLHLELNNIKCKHFAIITIVMFSIFYFLESYLNYLGFNNELYQRLSNHIFERTSIASFIISILAFYTFKNLKLKNNKIINTISSTTFGIYLIHDNNFIRLFIWEELFKLRNMSNNNILPVYSILIIFLIFIICSLIEFIRINTLEKAYTKLIKNKN